MNRPTRDGTAEPVSRDQILRHARGQGNINFPCSADHEQDWQPYPVDPYSAICDDHTYIHTYITLQGKETNFRGHKLTQNKVQKNKDKIKKTQRKSQHLRERYDTGSEK